MNIKVFKKLIKEAVIDAIHEELPYILEEHMAKQEKKALREDKVMNFIAMCCDTFFVSKFKWRILI